MIHILHFLQYQVIIAAREKCLSHDRDWMKKGISKRKTLRYVFRSTWYGTKI